MPRVTLSLFGPIQCVVAGEPISQFAYDKVQALLVYLATESARPHRREMLAGLLWPNQDEPAARHSLNQALWNLRQTVGDRASTDPVLRSSRETIQFNPEAVRFVDVLAFEALFERANRHVHRRPETCRHCMRWLAEAVELYRGPFLAQFSLADSPGFDEWVLVKRERFHQTVVGGIDRLVDYSERRGEDEQAIAYLRRLLELDSWREESHRRLMRLLARNGQRPAALAHFDRLEVILEQDLGAAVEQETRDLRDEIERGTSEPGRSRAGSPGRSVPLAGLPAQFSPLIGRERVLGDLIQIVASGEHRLITLTGPGGIGKTRLGLQLAHDETESFSNGACFVPLAGIASAGSLVQAIADARSLTFYGNRDPREQLLYDLHDQDLLLVLDNFEHVLEGADLVADILAEAPGIQIVVTSRERLNLYAEYVFPVQALDVPAATDDPDEFARSGAVKLFVRSAERARAGFVVQPSDVPDVVRVCQLVGGMPLGIELAAAWTPLLTCREIAQEIERSLDFLTASTRNVPERHRSMRAAFDHSWRLLASHERDVFMRLSVFHGGFHKEAAERVAGATLPPLLALMSKSFLTRSPVGRFEIHELLRQYAAAKLDEVPAEMAATFDAHARYYAEFLIQREARLRGIEQRTALQELIAESENIHAAWTWALMHARVDILEILVHVWLFYEVTGRYQELDGLLGEAIGILEHVADARAEVAVGRALTRQAAGILRVGAYGDSERVLARSSEILERHNEFAELGLNLNFMAMNAHAHEDYEKERDLLERSLLMSRRAGDEWVTAYSLNDLGMVSCLVGETDRAQELIQESLEIFIAIGDWRGRAFALNNLGTVVGRRGTFAEARRLHEESLQIRRSMKDRWGEAQSLTRLGIDARVTGAHRESGDCLRQALLIARDLHAYPLVLEVLTEMAHLFAVQEDRERAQTILRRVAEYTAGGRASTGAVRRISSASDDGQLGMQPPAIHGEPALADLDDLVALALRQEPRIPV